MDHMKNLAEPAEAELLVAFSDLTLFSRYAQTSSERELFETMASYFEFVGDVVEKAGGMLVKCIGDAALIAFTAERADEGVNALMTLREEGDRWLEGRGLPCRHVIKAHFGPVVCGPVGPKGDKRFDLYGKTVNVTALTKSFGLALTPQAFRKLEPETRKRFKKHTPPVTYIPVEADHRD